MSFRTGVRSRFSFLLILAILWPAGCDTSRDSILADAAAHMKVGEVDAARQGYQSILDENAYDLDALLGMVAITQSPEFTLEHTEWCRRLLQLRPWDRHANVVVGKDLLEQGNLKDAAVRFYLAYLDSDFAQDKQEILVLLEQVRQKEHQRLIPKEETPDGDPQRTDSSR